MHSDIYGPSMYTSYGNGDRRNRKTLCSREYAMFFLLQLNMATAATRNSISFRWFIITPARKNDRVPYIGKLWISVKVLWELQNAYPSTRGKVLAWCITVVALLLPRRSWRAVVFPWVLGLSGVMAINGRAEPWRGERRWCTRVCLISWRKVRRLLLLPASRAPVR